MRLSPRRLAVLLVPVTVLALTGCTDLQGTSGDQQWITGTGKVVQIAPADRGKPVSASGKDLDGAPLSLASYRGKVVMLTVWGAWCGPCRAEMPSVVSLANSFDNPDIAVLGDNIRETGGASSARAYAEGVDMPFPSFYDPSSAVLLALSARLGPYSLPSTVVLDREGRLAALVLGAIPGKVSMQEIVDQVAAEPSASPGTTDG